ncbi:Cytochrome b5 isoform E [Asimina triloba]
MASDHKIFVYDVTPFMDDHPGGSEVLLAATGKDATSDYEDIGHSDSAKDMMHQYCIGAIDASSIPPKRQIIPPQAAAYSRPTRKDDSMVKILQFLVPLVILGIVFVIRIWTKKD